MLLSKYTRFWKIYSLMLDFSKKQNSRHQLDNLATPILSIQELVTYLDYLLKYLRRKVLTFTGIVLGSRRLHYYLCVFCSLRMLVQGLPRDFTARRPLERSIKVADAKSQWHRRHWRGQPERVPFRLEQGQGSGWKVPRLFKDPAVTGEAKATSSSKVGRWRHGLQRMTMNAQWFTHGCYLWYKAHTSCSGGSQEKGVSPSLFLEKVGGKW